tara:strand:- start:3064 stop:5250 length:2187 start_codon:yes stop_codon:yes gene_type:complete
MRLSIFLTFLFFVSSLYSQNSGQYTSPSSGESNHAQKALDFKILYLAAHPDDENTRLIAHWSKFDGFNVAYLSLTRGEGGQNMIGSELGKSLGAIRSGELYAAREIDGAVQYFGEALDFGYSKSVQETLDKWSEEKLLNRIEAVIMEFKPDVIVTRFPADSRAGHGHHTASTILAIKAFENIKLRMKPGEYSPKAVYWNTSSWWIKDIEDNGLYDSIQSIEIGGFIPELGRSSLEIGTKARGMHKSQGFAGKIDRGFRKEYLKLLVGENINWNDIKKPSREDVQMNLEGVYIDFLAESPYFIKGEVLKSQIVFYNESERDYRFQILDPKKSTKSDEYKLDKHKNISVSIDLTSLDKKTILFKDEDSSNEREINLWPNYVNADRVLGEVRRPVQIAKSFSISYSMPCAVFVKDKKRKLNVSIHRWSEERNLKFDFRFPKGWKVEALNNLDSEIRFTPDQRIYNLEFSVEPQKNAKSGDLYIHDITRDEGLDRTEKIRYDHIPHQEVWLNGSLPIRYIPMDLPPLKVGYIKGVGDDAPMALAQMGVSVIHLDPDLLTLEQLNELDALLIGVRAYNVNMGLRSSQNLIDDYVRQGGRLVIQYNTSSRDRVLKKMGPLTFNLSRDRITFETAEPEMLKLDHIQMNSPNVLGKKDFENWVQERGLYFADSWDSSFIPMISWSDPGEKKKLGSWIVANYGKGTVTYCSLSLFRQWRHGVEGSYRILANLVGHGK